ncbi:hypothetical protein [uncultured Parasutterella sp.]|uniref:hypothetical protein n=1 Tax=uncultured Parasutterella sp. TaxID=1263098 RepID=UPI0025B64D58|nr:hypothetical protein [uncultured Parasutterella sp.]
MREVLAAIKEWFDSFFHVKTLTEDDVASLLYRIAQDAFETSQPFIDDSVKTSFAGEKGMASNSTATLNKAIAEEEVEKRGNSPKEIKFATGWIKASPSSQSSSTSETVPTHKAGGTMSEDTRKSSISALTKKQKDRNLNDVRRGLFKSWGVAVTNQLLNSGKVVICRSNEEFLDRMVEDEYANNPSKSKEEIR